MANSDYTNSVPLGQAGTGAAYILPQSQSAGIYENYLDTAAANNQKAAAIKLQQAQDLAKSYQTNRLNIKAGRLWQPEINERANKVTQMGVDLYKAGLDPTRAYNNPQQQALVDAYNSNRQELLNMAEIRDQYTQKLDENDKQYGAQPHGYFDQDGVDTQHKFMNTPLAKLIESGQQVPVLKRAFDLQPLVEKLPAVPIETTRINTKTGVKSRMVLPNKDAHEVIATNFLNNTPEVQADISKKAGMPYDQIGNSTDVEAIKKQLDDHYRSMPNIPSLAAQGIKSFGSFGTTNSNGVPDELGTTPPAKAEFKRSPQYEALLDRQANQMANAAKVKQDYKKMVVSELNNKVHQTDDKTLNYDYQQEMRARRRMGMEEIRFDDWKEDQQNEEGTFTLGNQDSYVPVVKNNVSKTTGVTGRSFVQPERGASLFGVNLPMVNTIVRPSLITDIKTGKTSKNTEPVPVAVSQIQMVPVYKDLNNNNSVFNGSEISARQLRELASGTNKDGANMKNVTFQPYVYGTKKVKDDKGHVTDVPVKFSFDAIKGSNVKKINTKQFDEAQKNLQEALESQQYKALNAEERYNWLKQTFNIQE